MAEREAGTPAALLLMVTMRRALICLSGILLAGGSAARPTTMPGPLWKTGTLVVVVATTSGWVIGADRRAVLTDQPNPKASRYVGVMDDNVKVFEVDKFTALAATGNVGLGHKMGVTITKDFDAGALAAQWLGKHNTGEDFRARVEQLGSFLKAKLGPIYASGQFAQKCNSGNQFELIIVGWNKAKAKRDGALLGINCSLPGQTSLPDPVVDVYNDSDAALVNVFGERSVWESLKGNDPDYDSERLDSAIEPALDNLEVSEQQAVAFVRALIQLTSTRLPPVYNGKSAVSPTTDIAAITPNKGFHWIYNDPTPSPSP